MRAQARSAAPREREPRVASAWNLGAPFTFETFTVRATIDDGGMGTYDECIEDDDELESEAPMTYTFG